MKGVYFMQSLMLCVTYTAKPGMRETFIREVYSSGILDKIHHEKGCLEYGYYLSVENEDDILLVEKWETEEQQQIHLKQPHMEVLKSIKERYVSNVRLEKGFLQH